MESVITDFLRKHDTVPRNELITFIKQMFELSSKTFFEKEEIQKEKKTKTKTTPKKKRTSSSSRQINGEEEKVSRRHLAEEKLHPCLVMICFLKQTVTVLNRRTTLRCVKLHKKSPCKDTQK